MKKRIFNINKKIDLNYFEFNNISDFVKFYLKNN